MKTRYGIFILVFLLPCFVARADLPIMPESGVYIADKTPLIDEQKNPDNSYDATTVTQHPPLLVHPYIPEFIWVVNPNTSRDDKAIKEQGLLPVRYIWLNPNLCKRFDNGMPHYPVFEDSMRGDSYSYRQVSEVTDDCIVDAARSAVSQVHTTRRDRFTLTSEPQQIKYEQAPLKDDPRCVAYGGCGRNVLYVTTFRQPQLKYTQFFGSSEYESVEILSHPIPVYKTDGDAIPAHILPAGAPFIRTHSQSPKENWQSISIPPGLISPEKEPISTERGMKDLVSSPREDRVYVKTQDTTTGVWVDQIAQHPKFDFKVSCTEDERPSTDGIAVYRKGEKQLYQLILGYNGDSTFSPCNDQVQLVDVNFDGYLDISIFAHDGGAGPNSGDYFFIFNPKTQKFDYHQQLSELVAPSIDSKNKTIISSWRGSCCDHGSETYTFKNGKMLLLSTWHQYLSVNAPDKKGRDLEITETSKRINGKMRHHTSHQRVILN